jgi:hypothetical protein
MSTEQLPISGGDDFVDISDVFLDAAQGMPMTLVHGPAIQSDNEICVDMEQGDVMLTEDFTLYDAMSALEAMRTRSDPRLLLMLLLFRSATLAWTAVSFSRKKRRDPSSIRSLLSSLKRFVIF